MYFTKYPHRANFSYVTDGDVATGAATIGNRPVNVSLDAFEDDVYRVRVQGPAWEPNDCLETLEIPPMSERHRLKLDDRFELALGGRDGKPLVWSPPGQSIGLSGQASLFQFLVRPGAKFFGMGEKTFGRVELSGVRTKFWNTDVWADFHFSQWMEHPTDPPYFSLPYLAARIGEEWVGFLLHNPYPTFMSTPGNEQAEVFVDWQRTPPVLQLGSEGGEPNLWILYGHSLRELTRKLQRLVGVTPVPPIWSLGYHQSRWGYGGDADLMDLDAGFETNQIPCDSLWLDLDYMDGFRVFQTSPAMFPDGSQATAEKLAGNGRRIVPILDPGVKFEPGYRVYDDGHANGVFCQNDEGGEFVGMVWPGETVFPDFTAPHVRDWWARYVADFAGQGFGATWVDMNDPATGPVDPQGMRFRKGALPHAAAHNTFALGMQMATREGFLQARPDERPFVLSRSGFVGSSKHAAIWTGDNWSNYFYLRTSIPASLGLSISGQPFNGPDVGGFGGDVTDGLMIDWVKACFLFPFMRNHAVKGSRKQEPFAFPVPVMKVLRRYIRLRYKLIPYLYNLFIDQEELGDPIMRPLFYEFSDGDLEKVNDQFMVGQWLMHAPMVSPDKGRSVVLPGEQAWFDARTGEWVEPGILEVRSARNETPLFVRAGAMIAMQPGTPTDNRKDLNRPNIHLFVPESWSGDSELVYRADDGISFGYRRGERSEVRVGLLAVDGHLAITWDQTADGFGEIEPTFIVHGKPRSVRLNSRDTKLTKAALTLTGNPLAAWRVD